MKRTFLLCLLACLPIHAATYYVASSTSTPAGNDAAAGSIGAPWLTLAHAVAASTCGDTIKIVADSKYVAGDVDLPYRPGCAAFSSIESANLSSLRATGYRVRPHANAPTGDFDNLGHLTLSGTGIRAIEEFHGSNQNSQNGYACGVTALASDTFTIWCSGSGLPVLANGLQIEFEVSSQGAPTADAPTGFSTFTKYYVRDCSVSPACGANGSTFKLAATSGGAALTGLSCSAPCVLSSPGSIIGIIFTIPLQVTAGSANIVMGDSPSTWGVNTLLTFGAVGTQGIGTLPAPLVKDTAYCITSLSVKTFQVAATCGGAAITITTNGTGPLNATNANVAAYWAFRGLEVVDGIGAGVGTMVEFGTGAEASNIVGIVNHIEWDRIWLHSQNNNSQVRGIIDNSANLNIHDSYINSFSQGESQAVAGCGSPGPTTFSNNFMEAAGEVTLYGGCGNGSGTANSNKTFTGNYYYKPPTWRFQSGVGAASGACLYDATDPDLAGGEWYTDTNTSQKYRCNSSGMWATTASTYPGYGGPNIKTGTEHKNGQNFTYTGNVMNYNWAAAQSGQWFNNSEEPGSGPGMANDHITIQDNALYNIYQFGNRESLCGLSLFVPCINNSHDHVTVNNLVVPNPLTCGVGFMSGLCGYQPYQGVALGGDGTSPTVLAIPFQNDTNLHNTIYAADSGWPLSFPAPMFADAAVCTPYLTMNLETYQNNIVPGDFQGACTSAGGIISNHFTNSTFSNNALLAGSSGSYGSVGTGNTWTNTVYPATNSVIKYVSATGTIAGDYHLDPTSPYSASNGSATRLSTDGTDLGADIDRIMWKTSGARAGTPNWDVQENLTITPLSNGATIVYDRPGTTACNLTIYNAPARIAANENADTNTSGKKLDSRTGNTVSSGHVTFNVGFNGALSAATQYWYALSCVAADTSTWLVAGDSFTTLSTAAPAPRRRGSSRRFSGSRN